MTPLAFAERFQEFFPAMDAFYNAVGRAFEGGASQWRAVRGYDLDGPGAYRPNGQVLVFEHENGKNTPALCATEKDGRFTLTPLNAAWHDTVSWQADGIDEAIQTVGRFIAARMAERDRERWPNYVAMDIPALEREIHLTYQDITPPRLGFTPPCGPIQLPYLREMLNGMERILRRKRNAAVEVEHEAECDVPAPGL